MVLGASAFGQISKNLPVLEAAETPYVITDKINNTQLYNFGKAPGDVLFSETFNGNMGGFTVAPGTMDTIWKFDTNGPDGQFSSTTNADIITSTTAANGFMIFDADLSNPGPSSGFGVRVGALTSPVIDMSGVSNGIISYENRYRTCCANAFFLKLQVSTDGFVTSQTYNVSSVNGAVNADVGTFVTKVNISDFLATATNLTNFQFRFFFDGNEGATTANTSHYFWQIDDVEVFESWTNDNLIIEHFMDAGTEQIPYYNMTLNQISPITFRAAVRNDGSAAAAGTILTTTVSNGGTGSVASAPISLAVGETDTISTVSWTPTATTPVTYDFTHTISATATDQNPGDNVLTDAMNITTSVYSVDNGTSGGSFVNVSSNTGQTISCGNIMEIFNDDWIESVSVSLNSTAANVGNFVKGEIWKFDVAADDFIYFCETSELTITSTNNNTTVTMPISGGAVPVVAGDILLVMQTNAGTVSVRTAQRVQQGVVVGNTSAGLFSLINPRALRVRLNLNPSLSINEIAEEITVAEVSPNPTNGASTLNFTARSAQNVSVQVVDVTGKIMQVTELGSIQAGGYSVDINSNLFNSGIYFVNIISTDGVVTKKLIKR